MSVSAPPATDTTPKQLVTAGLVAAAWLVIALLYLAGVAVLVPPLLLIGTAALLRGGRTVLDRVMLATGLLLGLTCLGALVFAVWPWGLHPVTAGGTAATALIVTAARTGRRPRLPRPGATDAIAVAAVAAVGAVVAWPLLRDGRTGRLARVMDGEDLARHAALFDAIRRAGGYLFQHPAQGRTLVYEGMVTYPQGEHVTAALLDGFLRSSAAAHGTGAGMFDHYLAFVAAGYLLLAATLVWAAQWIGAGGLTPARTVPVAAGIAGLCAFGELLDLVRFGYPSQVLGLAEAVMLLSVLVRPVPRPRQQLLLVAALLAAVGFTYYLYLPPVGLAAILWLMRQRRRHRARRVPALALAIAVTSAVPLAIGVLVAGQAGALLSVGSLKVGREGLAVLVCLVASGMLTRRGRRSGIWRSYALVFVPVAGFAIGMLAVQRLFGSGSGYYANKALFLVLALLLAGTGALALHLPRRPVPHAQLRAASVLMAIVALIGGERASDGPARIEASTSWLAGAGADQRAYARAALALRPGRPTVVIGDDPGYDSYRLTLFISTLQRTSGPMAGATYHVGPINSPARLDAVVTRMPGPMRLLVLSEDARVRAEALRDRHPAASIEIVMP
ncbi:hypothetical protein Daura_08435 [Dactylosporangium aurantiacum]|uniref:Uncharacterized protein n=1 Tax=Dactylosporangium aurantiacum TaxID=35754 RepID=A0A9Q9IJX7_9ACTN|nr:hypothetical protein [Dactylosporangium aurantiacum]MDG6104588.1 hypothetical protein [Dactylosporangium aurantiacum]UWZ56193.1 hypothetical protein Daura_08435 [Dactylosporangium aurantiacum]